MDKFIKSCEEMLDRIDYMELEAIIEALSPLPPEVEALTDDTALDMYVERLQTLPIPEA